MLVVENNEVQYNWSIGGHVNPLAYGGDVVVVFDPSKTNMAMLVGTPTGTILSIVEFSGNNRSRGPVEDTTLYCQEFRHFIKEYLKNTHLYIAGTEQAITKKGMEHHHSNMVLTEVRSNILNYFLEVYNMKALEINNWSWKSHCLPQGYRGHSEKGSKRFFKDYYPDSPYCNYYAADATDVICIYQYIIDMKCSGYKCICNRAEDALRTYRKCYTSVNVNLNFPMVPYNPVFSIDDNLNFYVNRMLTSFYMDVPIDKIDVKDVYGKTILFKPSDMDCDMVRVVVYQ